MVFAIPTPETMSEIAAIAASPFVIAPSTPESASSMSSWEIVVKSWWPRWRRVRSRVSSALDLARVGAGAARDLERAEALQVEEPHGAVERECNAMSSRSIPSARPL